MSQKVDHRPTWDNIWMNMAELVSRRSIDPRLMVGSVIITRDNTQVLSIGYNGQYAGGPNSVDSNSPGESGLVHSEINALLKLDFNNPKEKILYVTDSPCKMCAKCIVNAGINEVVYARKYRDTSGLQILRDAGVTIRNYKVTPDCDS